MASKITKAQKKKAQSLAQARRDQLIGNYVAKPKNKKSYLLCSGSVISGEEVTILGMPRIDHFFACEGDPDIIDVKYGPLEVPVILDTIEREVSFDAVVRFGDYRREFRSIRMNDRQLFELQQCAATELGVAYRIIDKEWIAERGQRIANWKRALAAHRLCKRISLAQYKGFITQWVKTRGPCTFAGLLALYGREHRPQTLAAIVELIAKRILASDLDHRMWSLHTTVSFRYDVP
jgi:hypothetical protein